MTLRSALALPLFILATFLAGGIGSWTTFESVRTWYPTLVKPSWNPPAWIFGPVWTTLYLLMSIAVWRVWRRREGAAALRLALAYGGHLVLNALWSVLFFGLRRPDLALLEIVLLWSVLAVLQFRLARFDRPAALLWAPYLAWVSFAGVLNFTIVRLNWPFKASA
jgi:tryptophan-rich sensory protein